ncbi:hypothetical protein F4779DRAFT_403999 [Xylariaceae sp. FL0662B]|nr:hypothetical protein F4779DRAFT_403999 [Xylariaceae sp. FL0662B]
MYGLGIAGKAGAKHVLATLLIESDGSMELASIKNVVDLSEADLRRILYSRIPSRIYDHHI